jgi:hypothetical protein
MKLKDCLSTEKNYKKLINLLRNGSQIRLCEGELTIKLVSTDPKMKYYKLVMVDKENNIVSNDTSLISWLLINSVTAKGYSKYLENLLKDSEYMKNVKSHLKYIDLWVRDKGYYLRYGKYLLKENPFSFKSDCNPFLRHLFKGLTRFLNKRDKVYLLLFKCDFCNHIHDISEFVTPEDIDSWVDLECFNEGAEVPVDPNNLYICEDCYYNLPYEEFLNNLIKVTNPERYKLLESIGALYRRSEWDNVYDDEEYDLSNDENLCA